MWKTGLFCKACEKAGILIVLSHDPGEGCGGQLIKQLYLDEHPSPQKRQPVLPWIFLGIPDIEQKKTEIIGALKILMRTVH